MITSAERAAMRATITECVALGSMSTATAMRLCRDVPALLDALDEMERELVRARLDGARAMQEAIKARCQCVARHEFGMVAQALADEIASIDPATVGTR